MNGERFARAMKFAADSVAALAGQRADFVVTQLLICDQQKQEPIFLGDGLERLLDTLSQFACFEDAQRAFRGAGGSFPDFLVVCAVNVSAMPGLKEILAMVNGDAIKPGSDAGLALEFTELSVSL